MNRPQMDNSVLIKQTLLKMAKLFHAFCEEQGLTYYMIGGTMLGAVRHQGFIPWDDDIDVGMFRQDYERLLSLRDRFPEGFSLNVHTDPGFHYGFCKMYDENTTYIEYSQSTRYVGGVYIDIFPLDAIGNDYQKALKIIRKIEFRKWIVKTIYTKGRRSTGWKTFASGCMKIFPKSPKWFDWPYRAVRRFKGRDSEYWTNVYGLAKEREVLSKEIFGKPTLYRFEDAEFYGVEQYDRYLSQIYGDYMTPPPEDRRGGHSIGYIDLEKPYREYLKEHPEVLK